VPNYLNIKITVTYLISTPAVSLQGLRQLPSASLSHTQFCEYL